VTINNIQGPALCENSVIDLALQVKYQPAKGIKYLFLILTFHQ